MTPKKAVAYLRIGIVGWKKEEVLKIAFTCSTNIHPLIQQRLQKTIALKLE